MKRLVGARSGGGGGGGDNRAEEVFKVPAPRRRSKSVLEGGGGGGNSSVGTKLSYGDHTTSLSSTSTSTSASASTSTTATSSSTSTSTTRARPRKQERPRPLRAAEALAASSKGLFNRREVALSARGAMGLKKRPSSTDLFEGATGPGKGKETTAPLSRGTSFGAPAGGAGNNRKRKSVSPQSKLDSLPCLVASFHPNPQDESDHPLPAHPELTSFSRGPPESFTLVPDTPLKSKPVVALPARSFSRTVSLPSFAALGAAFRPGAPPDLFSAIAMGRGAGAGAGAGGGMMDWDPTVEEDEEGEWREEVERVRNRRTPERKEKVEILVPDT